MNGLREFTYVFRRDTDISDIATVLHCEKALSAFFDNLGKKLGIRNFWKVVLDELDSDLYAQIGLDIKNNTNDPVKSCSDFLKYAKSVMNSYHVVDRSVIKDKYIGSVSYNRLQQRYSCDFRCRIDNPEYRVTVEGKFRVNENHPDEADLLVQLTIEP